MKKLKEKTAEEILALVITAIILFFIYTTILLLCWNWLMPPIFGLPVINWWQSCGFMIISNILFRGTK